MQATRFNRSYSSYKFATAPTTVPTSSYEIPFNSSNLFTIQPLWVTCENHTIDMAPTAISEQPSLRNLFYASMTVQASPAGQASPRKHLHANTSSGADYSCEHREANDIIPCANLVKQTPPPPMKLNFLFLHNVFNTPPLPRHAKLKTAVFHFSLGPPLFCPTLHKGGKGGRE